MKAAVHIGRQPHHEVYGKAMAAGLERHGVEVTVSGHDQPQPCDIAVIWGAPAKHPMVTMTARHLLVMERGHLPDRFLYASCGWDGLAGRGRYPKAPDGGQRWRERYGHLLQPWKIGGEYALVIGQVEGDAALGDLAFDRWAQQQTDALLATGWPVLYRRHPLASHDGRKPVGSVLAHGTLAEDLAKAAVVVTFNSTAGVEAVLAGVPTVTLDEGAMAWPVTSHALGHLVRPSREAWAHDLAWTGWTLEEIASGDAWAHLGPIMEGA